MCAARCVDLSAKRGSVASSRQVPYCPDAFAALLEEKEFTNGSDKAAVKALYRKMSAAQLGGIKMLDFDGMQPPSVAEARGPARVFSVADLPRAVLAAAAGKKDDEEDKGGASFDVSFLVPGVRCRGK